jgi:hypothetical protein
MVGDFARAWSTDSEEIDAMDPELDNGLNWSPSTRDFAAVANATVGNGGMVVSTFGHFLGAIQANRNISRIDLITHATPGIIGLKGKVDRIGDVDLEGDGATPLENRGISFTGLTWLNTTNEGKALRNQLRQNFNVSARIFIFACNGGLAQGLGMLQDLARTFNVAVSGFAEEIEYQPEFDTKRRFFISRNLTRYESHPIDLRTAPFHAGFGHLTPDIGQAKPAVPLP